jgi:hypothetical protein
MLTLHIGQAARLPTASALDVNARPQAGQWNRKLAPSPCMSRGKLSVAARTGNYKGKCGGHLASTIDYRSSGAPDGPLPLSVERAGDAMIITVAPSWRFTASPTGLLIEWQDRLSGPWSQKTYLRDRIRDVSLDRTRGDDGRDRYEVCIFAPLPHVEPVRYFDVSRREAEMIINAIREGLRM